MIIYVNMMTLNDHRCQYDGSRNCHKNFKVSDDTMTL